MVQINWRTPEDLVRIGFNRARVVMMNEAHDGMARCIRTRQVGQLVTSVAHDAGARHLAMEALWVSIAAEANRTRRLPEGSEDDLIYLGQPDMRAFIQGALDLGWTLIAYEMEQPPPHDLSEREIINWREEVQAHNLVAALHSLPAGAPLFVWCGLGHHSKLASPVWTPMGYHFKRFSGVDHFVIDQVQTVVSPRRQQLLDCYVPELNVRGGTGGFLIEEGPPSFIRRGRDWADAFIFSTQNEME